MGSLITETPHSEVTATLEILDRLGVGRDHLKQFRRDPAIQKTVAQTLRKSVAPVKVEPEYPTYTVTVDYDQSLNELFDAGGYSVNAFITPERFPIKGAGKQIIEIVLVRPRRLMKTLSECIETMDAKGYRPARIEELLAFGIQHPEVQSKHSIVALGTVAKIFWIRNVAFIGFDYEQGNRAGLFPLHTFESNRWSNFAFVRKD